MKKIYIIAPFLLISFISSIAKISLINTNKIRNNLKGEWTYQFSYSDTWKGNLKTNDRYPAYRIVFTECIDSIDLKSWTKSYPGKTIVMMRTTNILKNLKYHSFDSSNKLIDIYYPVARISNDTVVKSLHISEYGKTFKDNYSISNLNDSILEIYNGIVYTFESKKYCPVFHIYKKTIKTH